MREKNQKEKEYHRLYMIEYRKLPEIKKKETKYMIGYWKTPKGKIRKQNERTKSRAKRRQLGFIPLNEPFEGAEGHHIDFEYVVYIPEQLHTSISHNVWTGKGMNDINAKVLDWLFN